MTTRLEERIAFTLNVASDMEAPDLDAIVSGDDAEIVFRVTGLEPGDDLPQAALTAKVATSDADAAETTSQLIVRFTEDTTQPAGIFPVALAPRERLVVFRLTGADTAKMLTATTYNLRFWLVRNGLARIRSTKNGTITAETGATGATKLTFAGSASLDLPIELAGSGGQKFKGTASLLEPAPSLAGTGKLRFRGGAALNRPAPALAATGKQRFRGSAALSPPGPALAARGVNVAGFLSDIGGSSVLPGLYIPGVKGVRLPVGGGTAVGVVDDVRCSTSTGRIHFPGVSGEKVTLGDYTALNGASKLSVSAWFTPTSFPTSGYIFSRSSALVAGQQFIFSVTSSGRVAILISDGVSLTTAVGGTILNPGGSYAAHVVFDGTQATNATRVLLYLSSYDQTSNTWSAPVAETMSFTGTIPATLVTVAGVNATIGDRDAIGTPLNGQVDEVRVWAGTALSAAQVAAETLSTNAVPANLRYSFNGDANNSGSTAGFNGTASSACVYCSDDLRYVPLWSAGASRPSWNATTRVLTFDGFDDYLRGGPGQLGTMTDDGAMCYIGTGPSGAGHFADHVSAAPSRWLRLYKTGSTDVLAGQGAITDTIPYQGGVRVLHVRRTGVGPSGVIGLRYGSGAEVTSADSSQSATGNGVLTIGAQYNNTSYAALGMRAFVMYRGNYASGSQYQVVNALAQALGATL